MDKSAYTAEFGRVFGRSSLTLSAYHLFDGSERKAAALKSKVYFEFKSTPMRDTKDAENYQGLFLKGCTAEELRAYEGGDPINFTVFFVTEKGRIKNPTSFLQRMENAQGHEFDRVTCEVAIQDFLILANSDQIDCRFGVFEFRLAPGQVEGLKDFASRLAFDEATLQTKLARTRAEAAANKRKGNARPDAAKADRKRRASQAESRLRIATEMENIEDIPGAITFYKSVVEMFSDFPQAKITKERLEVLRAQKKEE